MWTLHAREPARWIELRSPHFTFVSSLEEHELRRVAVEFERVRAWLQQAHTNARFDSPEPVVVLAVSGEEGLRELLPQFWERTGRRPAAAYWRGPYRHCIALRTDAPERERYRRVLHEYVHLLTHATVPDLPVWLDEGVSELWGTAIVRGDAIEVGRAPADNLRVLLSQPRWMPFEELLALDRVPDPRDTKKLSLFYAQSWALVHYLMLGGLSPHLDVARAGDIDGMAHFDATVAAYVKRGRFRALAIAAPTESDREAESRGYGVRALTPASSLATRAGCLADGERAAAALPLLARALADDPGEAAVLETLGYVHFQRNDPVESAMWFDRAIASGSGSHLAYFYRAILAALVPDEVTSGQPVAAEHYLRRTIDLSPRFAAAYSRLAGLYARQDGRLSEAVPLLRRATELEPENPASWIELATVLRALDQFDAALRAGEMGLSAARTAGSRKAAEDFLHDLRRSLGNSP